MKRKKQTLSSMMRKLKKQLKTGNKSDNLKKNASKMSKKMTAPEKKFFVLMKEIGEEIECQKIVGSKIYDFYIPRKNMLIEVDGDYWHSNPEFYKKEDLSKMQKRNQKNDSFKDVLAIGMGYKIERIWENDLNERIGDIKNRIIELLK